MLLKLAYYENYLRVDNGKIAIVKIPGELPSSPVELSQTEIEDIEFSMRVLYKKTLKNYLNRKSDYYIPADMRVWNFSKEYLGEGMTEIEGDLLRRNMFTRILLVAGSLFR